MNQIGIFGLGIASAIIIWFWTNYWGKPILKFQDLRRDVNEAILLSSHISRGLPATLARAENARATLGGLGIKIHALGLDMPVLLRCYVRAHKLDLLSATDGLTGLANSLGTRDTDAMRFRIQAQKGLRLPCDPKELERVEREKRLENIPL